MYYQLRPRVHLRQLLCLQCLPRFTLGRLQSRFADGYRSARLRLEPHCLLHVIHWVPFYSLYKQKKTFSYLTLYCSRGDSVSPAISSSEALSVRSDQSLVFNKCRRCCCTYCFGDCSDYNGFISLEEIKKEKKEEINKKKKIFIIYHYGNKRLFFHSFSFLPLPARTSRSRISSTSFSTQTMPSSAIFPHALRKQLNPHEMGRHLSASHVKSCGPCAASHPRPLELRRLQRLQLSR